MLTNQIRKNLIDICAVIGKKHGWLADCKEAGYSDEELRFMEEVDEKINDLNDNVFIEKWKEEKPIHFIRGGKYSSDKIEIERAREYPLDGLVPALRDGRRIPCPFHKGEGNNFSVKNGRGHCFTCGENADSIKWLMEFDGMEFMQAVRYLNK